MFFVYQLDFAVQRRAIGIVSALGLLGGCVA